MADNKGTHLLTTRDFVDVVDEAGNDLGYQVPKHWGADQLAPGAKKKSGRTSAASSSSGSTPAAPTKPEGEPAGNASTEDWVAYAKSKGATEDDLKDEQGEPLGQKALREKYGTPTGS
ncbi:hypothetical protein [Nocardioides sp. Arc9.136]|uniref:hypothetical protein n=1 Tax=Nocardioides sp. Arc9.136 TaxID=2996826 RepID=UPI0026666C1B|nr:hypothetical protein [Nocardioides sp. Arc9.136]WKN47144.1 hypothetical protein OSR43_13960 [Nocardioides sp. Arc9.136]